MILELGVNPPSAITVRVGGCEFWATAAGMSEEICRPTVKGNEFDRKPFDVMSTMS